MESDQNGIRNFDLKIEYCSLKNYKLKCRDIIPRHSLKISFLATTEVGVILQGLRVAQAAETERWP